MVGRIVGVGVGVPVTVGEIVGVGVGVLALVGEIVGAGVGTRRGVRLIELPMTPERVFDAVRARPARPKDEARGKV